MTLAATLFASTTAPEPLLGPVAHGYLRPEYLRECPHEALMHLLDVITRAPNRDALDDQALDQVAHEIAARQSPLCRVCALGEPGVCDERCDWIPGAKMEGWRAPSARFCEGSTSSCELADAGVCDGRCDRPGA
jgi:hypothetical protein